MRVARCTYLECKSENDSKTMMKAQGSALENIYKEAEFSLSVRTGPISTLTVSVYPSEDAANANQPARKQWFKDLSNHVEEQFFYEGEVMIHKNFDSTESEKSSTSASKSQVNELKAEVRELKEMLSQVLGRA